MTNPRLLFDRLATASTATLLRDLVRDCMASVKIRFPIESYISTSKKRLLVLCFDGSPENAPYFYFLTVQNAMLLPLIPGGLCNGVEVSLVRLYRNRGTKFGECLLFNI